MNKSLARYKSAFLVPASAKKVLYETGWEFTTNDRIPEEVLDALIQLFSMKKEEEFSGVRMFKGPSIKISVIQDETGEIEEIYFQLFDMSPEKVRERLPDDMLSGLEFFVP